MLVGFVLLKGMGIGQDYEDIANQPTVMGTFTYTLGQPEVACDNGNTEVILSWSKPKNNVFYFVQRSPQDEESWNTISKTLKNRTSYTDTSIDDQTGTFDYRIRAISSRSEVYSNIVTVTIPGCDGDTMRATPPPPASGTQTPPPATQLPPVKVTPPPPPAAAPSKPTTPPPPAATPPPAPQVTPPPAAPTPPPAAQAKRQWGAFVGYDAASTNAFESLVGKTMNLQAVFAGWGSSGGFPEGFEFIARDKGKTLVIFWEQYGTTLDNIISGKDDAYIRQFATAAKNYRGPIILVPFHEMNGDWDPWDGLVSGNSPAKLVSAWRRVHDVFGAASNVKWGWAPNVSEDSITSSNAIEKYYPGDAYTDYVGADGFNFASPWQSFSQVFNTTLTRLAAYKKPIYIFSFASGAGTNKAAWITDALNTQMAKYNIAGWVWFNENKERDWRVNSDSASLAAFKAGIQ